MIAASFKSGCERGWGVQLMTVSKEVRSRFSLADTKRLLVGLISVVTASVTRSWLTSEAILVGRSSSLVCRRLSL